MKTSNKLLIAFASALIIIPLLGMIYVSRVNFKPGKFTDIAERKIENLSTPTRNMSSITTLPYQSVNVEDAKGYTLKIRFIKDEKFGVKIPTEYKDAITATVDAGGQLQFVFKNRPSKEDGGYYTEIFLYAPNVKEVNVSNADGAFIVASLDSLSFKVNNTPSAGVGSGTHLIHLNFTATNVADVNFSNDDVKSLNLNLNNAIFKSVTNSYENLSVTTTGACIVEIRGDYDGVDKYSIKNLALNTTGKTEVKVENMTIANCTGSLSDETTVSMPAVNLNQMYKK